MKRETDGTPQPSERIGREEIAAWVKKTRKVHTWLCGSANERLFAEKFEEALTDEPDSVKLSLLKFLWYNDFLGKVLKLSNDQLTRIEKETSFLEHRSASLLIPIPSKESIIWRIDFNYFFGAFSFNLSQLLELVELSSDFARFEHLFTISMDIGSQNLDRRTDLTLEFQTLKNTFEKSEQLLSAGEMEIEPACKTSQKRIKTADLEKENSQTAGPQNLVFELSDMPDDCPSFFFKPFTLAEKINFRYIAFEDWECNRVEYSGFLPDLPAEILSAKPSAVLPNVDYDLNTDDEYNLLDAEDCSKEMSAEESELEEELQSEDKNFIVDDSYASDTEEDHSFFRREKPSKPAMLDAEVQLTIIDFRADPSSAASYRAISLIGKLEEC